MEDETMHEETNESGSGLASSFFSIFASILKTIWFLFMTIVKFFIRLPIGGKIIFILLICIAVLISYGVGFKAGEKSKVNYYENELGLTQEEIDDLKPVFKNIQENGTITIDELKQLSDDLKD
ncbi:hypothetical protein KC669_00690 [Candidatus Dojkabacteria bacterium]|uniref:Uncharacterized protein n=1 Tax=Candidatus Dojkabacteria bacterium TaxID=2099670 RepID=A0A955L9J9_9BACT|nr:hypothetical protein [Candidatus Dojkabacteria bacterium]